MQKTAFVFLLTAPLCRVTARAVVYNVNRFFTDSDTKTPVTLTGTVSIPVGNYVLGPASTNPFTATNLVMKVNGTSFNFSKADIGVQGTTAQLFIDATQTTLTFSTAGTNGQNIANVGFYNGVTFSTAYIVGSDFAPHYEIGRVNNVQYSTFTPFPLVFGTSVPEPTSAALVAFAAMFFGMKRPRKTINLGQCDHASH